MSKLTRERKRVRMALYAAMDSVYARIPDSGCKGLCHEYCTSIMMTPVEAYRLKAAGGADVNYNRIALAVLRGREHSALCPNLTADKRCRVYADRPLVCRTFGSTPGNPCPFGCTPEDGKMTEEAAGAVFHELMAMASRYLPELEPTAPTV